MIKERKALGSVRWDSWIKSWETMEGECSWQEIGLQLLWNLSRNEHVNPPAAQTQLRTVGSRVCTGSRPWYFRPFSQGTAYTGWTKNSLALSLTDLEETRSKWKEAVDVRCRNYHCGVSNQKGRERKGLWDLSDWIVTPIRRELSFYSCPLPIEHHIESRRSLKSTAQTAHWGYKEGLKGKDQN